MIVTDFVLPKSKYKIVAVFMHKHYWKMFGNENFPSSLLIWLFKFGGMSKKNQKESKKPNSLHKYFAKNNQGEDKGIQ